MKIAHVSDIHIRNLKYHSEYRNVFDDFYRKLDELKPDLVVNTGDTAHTKTNISPEFVDMTKDLFRNIAQRAPLLNVLGNHDLNLMNEDRQDAITPIVQALRDPQIKLLKKSGLYSLPWSQGGGLMVNFWNFGIADVENWPRPPYPENVVNIGLFHGSIRGCFTDSNFRMTQVEYDQTIFDGLDFVMMGDIHKRQWFREKRIWYAGSMIQQNFGEDPDKGFLLWDIRSKDDFDVTFHELKGNRRFFTVKLNDDLSFEDVPVEKDSRVRLLPPRSLTLVEQKGIEKIARKKYEPYDLITLGAQNIGQKTAEVSNVTEKIENIRKLDVQERLIRDFFKNEKIPDGVMTRILDLNRKYQISIEQKDDVARGVKWRVLKMGWNNLYNYGEGNVVDFSQIKGLTGIFAPNASGKSGLIDVLTIGMFDCNTKEVAKNVHLINDNKENATAILELMSNGERYTITRNIERIKYGQRKKNEKEWGKTTLDVVKHNAGTGAMESLVGELRPQTEAAIRKNFGSFDDFMLTSLFAQWDPMDLIMCKETDRKRILFRFLDLDIFEDKAKLAKDESRQWVKKLEEMEENDYENAAAQLREKIAVLKRDLQETGEQVFGLEIASKEFQRKIEKLLEDKQSIPQIPWNKNDELVALTRAEKGIVDAQIRIEQHEKHLRDLESESQLYLLVEDVFDVETNKIGADNYLRLRDEVSEIEHLIEKTETELENLNRQAGLLDKVPCGDKFPDCQFLVNAFAAKKDIPKVIYQQEVYAQDLIVANNRLRDARLKKDKYDEYMKKKKDIDAWKNSVATHKLQIERFKAQLEKDNLAKKSALDHIEAVEKVAFDILRNDDLDKNITKFRREKYEVDARVVTVRNSISNLTKQLGLDEGKLSALDKELEQIAEIREVCHAFEKFIDAMGKDGIALQILTQKLPLINEEINKILAQSAEFGAKIEYDKDEQSIRLYIQYGQYKSRLLELGSGAEKFLASVAIRSALLSVSNLPRSNLFIIDEGFGKLDPQNLEAVTRMFDYLRSVFDHVIVISHLDTMKDLVDNIIEINPDEEGYAHVEIGA